jgi:hypothetical protein
MDKRALAAFTASMNKEAGFFSFNPTEGQEGEVKGFGEGKSETLKRLEANPSGLKGAKQSGAEYKKDYTDVAGSPEASKAFDAADPKAIKDAIGSGFKEKLEGAGFGAVDKAKRLNQGSELYNTEGKGGLSEWEQMNPSQKLAPQQSGMKSVLPNKWTDTGRKRMAAEQTASSPEMKNIVQTTQKAYNDRIGEAVQKWGPWVAGLGLGGLGLYLALNQQGQPAAQQNAAVKAPDDWAKDNNWQSPGSVGEGQLGNS